MWCHSIFVIFIFWSQLWNQLSSPAMMFSTKSLLSVPCLPRSSEGTHICAHFCLPVSKSGTQQQHTFQYPSQSQHHLLQHTVFSSKLCWNFSVMFDELIIFMLVDAMWAVHVQMLQDRSVMSVFPSFTYFTLCLMVCTHADICIVTDKTDWQICSEIVLLHKKFSHLMVVQWSIIDSQFVAVVCSYILVYMHCACISGWRKDDTTSHIIPSLWCYI